MGPTERISSDSPYELTIGFSRAIRRGNHLFVSGIAPLDEKGQTVGVGDLYQQTCRCIEVARAALTKAGAELDDVVRTRVLLSSMVSWEEAARAHAKFFREIKPATTFIQVDGFLDPQWQVKIELDALIAHDCPPPCSARALI